MSISQAQRRKKNSSKIPKDGFTVQSKRVFASIPSSFVGIIVQQHGGWKTPPKTSSKYLSHKVTKNEGLCNKW